MGDWHSVRSLLQEEIRGFTKLPQVAVDFAIDFLDSLQPCDILPQVSPISTGVYLEWRFKDDLASLEIDDESVFFSVIPGRYFAADMSYNDPSFSVAIALSVVRVFLDTVLANQPSGPPKPCWLTPDVVEEYLSEHMG